MSKQIKVVLTREMKAQQIVKSKSVIKVKEDYYKVYSQRDPNQSYDVNPIYRYCSCKDFELRQEDCKHLKAVDSIRLEAINNAVRAALFKIGVVPN